jgi:hypothetical protein
MRAILRPHGLRLCVLSAIGARAIVDVTFSHLEKLLPSLVTVVVCGQTRAAGFFCCVKQQKNHSPLGALTKPWTDICRRISVLHHYVSSTPFSLLCAAPPPALLHHSMQRGACCVIVQCSIAAAIAAWGVWPRQGNVAADDKKQSWRRCSPIALASGCHSTHQV